MTRPWPDAAATGIGSMPGTDIGEALRVVFGELPEFPHLPELPARGPGAELIGRSGALLVDLPVEVVPTGWRLTARVGRDLRRAREFMLRDLDALQTQADGYHGALKVQVAGPWTIAAQAELPSGHKIVSDHGAVRELAGSLAEGLRVHVADVSGRVPGARLVVQVDEPSLPAVLAGRVPTPSGYGTVRAVEAETAERVLRSVLDAAPDGARVVHCCAPDAPIGLLRTVGANAIAVDAQRLGRRDYDALGEATDGGVALWLGIVPATGERADARGAHDAVRRLWSDLGFEAAALASAVVLTPNCGLAGASPEYTRRVFEALRDVSARLRDPDAHDPDAHDPDAR